MKKFCIFFVEKIEILYKRANFDKWRQIKRFWMKMLLISFLERKTTDP